jgi:hypothetical protein
VLTVGEHIWLIGTLPDQPLSTSDLFIIQLNKTRGGWGEAGEILHFTVIIEGRGKSRKIILKRS